MAVETGMIPLHDHHLVEFSVRATEKLVRLLTAYPGKSGPNTAETVFAGVEAFIVEGDTLGTIIGEVSGCFPATAPEERKIYRSRSLQTCTTGFCLVLSPAMLYPTPRADRWDPWILAAVFVVLAGAAALINLW